MSLLRQSAHIPNSNERSLCAPEPARPGQESGAYGSGSNRRGCRKREPEAVIINESCFELHIRGESLDGRDRVPDFVDDLRRALV